MPTIRKASKSELDQIFQLWLELMDEHRDRHIQFRYNHDETPLIKKVLEERFDAPGKCFMVLEEKGEIIGFSSLAVSENRPGFPFKKEGYIAETIVTKKYQGQGMGKLMFEAIQAYFLEQGVDHIALQVSVANEAGMRFWEGLGFTATTKRMVLSFRTPKTEIRE